MPAETDASNWKRSASRVTTLALVAISVFVALLGGSLVYLLFFLGERFIECEYVPCGSKGQYVSDNGRFFLLGYALVSLTVGFAVSRRIR